MQGELHRSFRRVIRHAVVVSGSRRDALNLGGDEACDSGESLDEGDVALVTDAGTPGISDPGFPLIRDAINAGHQVVPIPGASSVLAALTASGLPMHAFLSDVDVDRVIQAVRDFFRA